MKDLPEEPDFLLISSGPNKITVTGVLHGTEAKNMLSIGVSRCGNDDYYNEEQGVSIALHRTRIQPWNRIPMDDKSTTDAAPLIFKILAESIIDHVRRTNGWATSLKKEREGVVTPASVY